MSLLICPGIHSPDLTDSFLAGLQGSNAAALTHFRVFPADRYPPYSAFHILETLYDWLGKPASNSKLDSGSDLRSDSRSDSPFPTSQSYSPQPHSSLSHSSKRSLVFLSFSAGVVGAIGAARTWQRLGGDVKAFIAVDGWGVPLRDEFPLYRVSHDLWTHWSSALLGNGEVSFYADPAVAHLDLWRSPQTTRGWQLWDEVRSPSRSSCTAQRRTTAAAFLLDLLDRHAEIVIR
jgi:hypothetical protein